MIRRLLCRLLGHKPWNVGSPVFWAKSTVLARFRCQRCREVVDL